MKRSPILAFSDNSSEEQSYEFQKSQKINENSFNLIWFALESSGVGLPNYLFFAQKHLTIFDINKFTSFYKVNFFYQISNF